MSMDNLTPVSLAKHEEIISYGRNLLWQRVLGPDCKYCGKIATDVYVVFNISRSTDLEVIPVCDLCKHDFKHKV